MPTWFQDLRHSVRSLLASPAVTVAVVLCMALAIGANSAIFSVLDGVLLNPLPYREPGDLVWVWGTWGEDGGSDPLADADFIDLASQSPAFSGMAALTGSRLMTATGRGMSEGLRATQVSTGYFDVLGRPPVLGRGFVEEDGRPQAKKVVIIGHGLWARRFSSSPAAIGQLLHLDGYPYEIVGVLPPGFHDVLAQPGREPEAWLPLVLQPDNRGMARLLAIGRLAPESNETGAQQSLDIIASRLAQAYPATNAQKGWRPETLQSGMLGDLPKTLLMLSASVGLVLLIACANVANLLLARANGRRREMALRAALGAGRARLLRQQLGESLLLGLTGGLLGLALAFLCLPLLVQLAVGIVPRIENVQIDFQVLLFTGLVSLLAGLLFGILPALGASRAEASFCLVEGERGGTASRRQRRLSQSLVAAEVALALVVSVLAGLLVRSYTLLQSVDPGFESDNRIVASLNIPANDYSEAALKPFYDALQERLRALPGVEQAARSESSPFSPYLTCLAFDIEGYPPFEEGNAPCAELRQVSANYFSTLGIPLLAGKRLAASDAQPEAVINQTMASRLFPRQDPIGRRITFGGPTYTIVGIVGNTLSASLRIDPQMQVYAGQAAVQARRQYLVVHADGPTQAFTPLLRAELSRLDSNLVFESVLSMSGLLQSSTASFRLRTLLMGLFAVIALVLATVGIYGVLSHHVVRRRGELGIRMALGASPREVLSMVMLQALGPLGGGLIAGVVLALLASRTLAGVLFEVEAHDLATFAAVPLLLLLVGLVSCWLPALRAARVDPISALRGE